MAETREVKEIFIRKSEGRREVVRCSAWFTKADGKDMEKGRKGSCSNEGKAVRESQNQGVAESCTGALYLITKWGYVPVKKSGILLDIKPRSPAVTFTGPYGFMFERI